MYHYVIVRDDLPRGTLAAMVVHAAGETSPGNLPDGTYAVVLAVPSEGALLDIASILLNRNIPHKPIVECDGPFAGQLMAIGVRPGLKKEVGKHLSCLPLLK